MVYFSSKTHLHLGLSLLVSLGAHVFALLSVQVGSGVEGGREPSHNMRFALTFERPMVESKLLPVKRGVPLHQIKKNTGDEVEREKSGAAKTSNASSFIWQPTVNWNQNQALPSDPEQAAIAAQMRQFQIRALMESLTEVASNMAPHIMGDHVCKIDADHSVSCDLPAESEWNDTLIHWLALQIQLRDFVNGNVPASVSGKHGNLTLQRSVEQP